MSDIKFSTGKVLHGDCVARMRKLPDCSVDAVVCDPPYELGFMGKKWDSSGIAYQVDMWAEALRILKPGGHLLAFGGTRTYHRMACAIEDAGFEIRDSIHWVYGSGFPKSHNISIAIDKQSGAMEHIGRAHYAYATGKDFQGRDMTATQEMPAHEGITQEAKQWEGWGTALKPAHEPIVVARKPLSGTVAANVLKHGTGGLNIDGSRVGSEILPEQRAGEARIGTFERSNMVTPERQGRWPANIVLDETAAAALDQQNEGAARYFTQADWGPDDWPFVYQAKPSKRERNAGLDSLPDQSATGSLSTHPKMIPASGKAMYKNTHPTVKPVALMRHLVKLVTPPGGTVLDPFLGSGTTAVAAILEGFNWIGCEMTDDYLPIIKGRVEWAEKQVAEAAKADKQLTSGDTE